MENTSLTVAKPVGSHLPLLGLCVERMIEVALMAPDTEELENAVAMIDVLFCCRRLAKGYSSLSVFSLSEILLTCIIQILTPCIVGSSC